MIAVQAVSGPAVGDCASAGPLPLPGGTGNTRPHLPSIRPSPLSPQPGNHITESSVADP